jgi:hypothetical protein
MQRMMLRTKHSCHAWIDQMFRKLFGSLKPTPELKPVVVDSGVLAGRAHISGTRFYFPLCPPVSSLWLMSPP